MSRVTRGKLDVPQLRESRCPLTYVGESGDWKARLAQLLQESDEFGLAFAPLEQFSR